MPTNEELAGQLEEVVKLLDNVTATDSTADDLGCAENALDRILAALRAQPQALPDDATGYPERIWYTPADNSSREYVRGDLYDALRAQPAQAGEPVDGLSPCPFCSEIAVMRQDDDPGYPFYVTFDHLESCPMYAVPTDLFRSYATEAGARAAWNTRATPPAQAPVGDVAGLVGRLAPDEETIDAMMMAYQETTDCGCSEYGMKAVLSALIERLTSQPAAQPSEDQVEQLHADQWGCYGLGFDSHTGGFSSLVLRHREREEDGHVFAKHEVLAAIAAMQGNAAQPATVKQDLTVQPDQQADPVEAVAFMYERKSEHSDLMRRYVRIEQDSAFLGKGWTETPLYDEPTVQRRIADAVAQERRECAEAIKAMIPKPAGHATGHTNTMRVCLSDAYRAILARGGQS